MHTLAKFLRQSVRALISALLLAAPFSVAQAMPATAGCPYSIIFDMGTGEIWHLVAEDATTCWYEVF